ncbi:hypothetical protein BV22DRAFT_1082792 [Leucogyrophana mollusca]|uniref:Uncharacterized protein n=1 Tax=Leucogyrophana mollusca TaxID=85980 RepID=A0ACB8BSS5_9AGAM|nr:hypothetical protein BV22DRAFT_1082792 [Leucogyrophana mollusca]
MSARSAPSRGRYREIEVVVAEFDEESGGIEAELQEPGLLGLIPRNQSCESLASTQSTTYSGLDDLTEAMLGVPEELYNPVPGILSSSQPRDVAAGVTASSAGSPPASSLSSDASSTLGKRKADGPAQASSSSSKHPKTVSKELPFIIANSRHLQRYFDAKHISFGVQWLVARLTTLDTGKRITYEQVSVPDLDKLVGSNQHAAPQAVHILRQSSHQDALKEMCGFFSREKAATSPWKELDLEQEFATKKLCGDGFHRQENGWYGGKVQFTAKLKVDDEDKSKIPATVRYKIQLNWPEVGPSTRFKRQFGSKNFFRVQIPKAILNTSDNGLVEFFSQRFVLCGIVFRAFYAKDNNVFLVATDELAPDAIALPFHAIPRPPSFIEFINWHNPIHYNLSQSMAKWAARFALGLSNSVPGLQLEQRNILHIDDIVNNGSEMTDGCGYINKFALNALREILDWDSCPTAIQCRVGGAKGLLLLHPNANENESDTPRIWLRDSQVKVKYQPDIPPSAGRLVIDVLRAAHLRTPSRLSAETIVNLAENGVPHEVFIDLVKRGLDTIVDGLLDWDGPDAMYRLWRSVARSGHVFAARQAREAGGEARAKGFSVKDAEDDDDEEEEIEDDPDTPRSAAWWGDEVSGCPSSLEETVMVFLDAGFGPRTNPVLADKIRNIIRTSAENYVQRYRLEVPMSLIAWIVPDPTGSLAPNEVHIISKECQFIMEDGTESNIILGDVLLTRHPCKLPTDTQKVTAVDKPELRHYTDVIVCSIQGTRRFADLLAGGDYDGDKAIAIWEPTIVKNFTNADLVHSNPPQNFLGSNFLKNSLLAREFWTDNSHEHWDVVVPAMQSFLLGGLRDTSLVGKYSNFHDLSIYMAGYDHPETTRLAYMFTHILDASKSGLVVVPSILQQDVRLYQKRSPAWKETPAEREKHALGNAPNPRRPPTMPRFIMDKIFDHAIAYRDYKLAEVKKIIDECMNCPKDAALMKPWEDAIERARRIREEMGTEIANRIDKELETIRTHVETMRAIYAEKIGAGQKFTKLKIEHRQDVLRSLAQDFAFRPPVEKFILFSQDEVARLKASYAYIICKSNYRFPWDVAMRELGSIKAKSLGPSKTIQLGFYERFVLKQSSYRSS